MRRSGISSGIVEIHFHRRSARIGFDLEREDDVLRQFLVPAREQPKFSCGNRAVDVFEQLVMFDAQRCDVAKELAHFGENASGSRGLRYGSSAMRTLRIASRDGRAIAR
jgi:hypothetical protein